MPLYEYTCQECNKKFDKLNSYENRHAPESEPCPYCFGSEVKYTISTPMISYSHKGSMKTTDNFNDRLKEIKKKLPARHQQNISDNIR